MVKKMEHYKVMMILYSAIFLSLALSVYIFPSPLLIYTSEYVNLLAFFIVVIHEGTESIRSLSIHRDIAKAFSFMFVTFVAFVFLVLYIVSLTQKYQTLIILFGLIMDLFVLFAASKFARDFIQIKNLHKWVKSLP
jgi:hypothetical protein